MVRLGHDIFPCKLLLLLLDTTLAEMFQNESGCQLDTFTKAFISRFAASGLDHNDALMTLRLLAWLCKADSSLVEALHASLRRIINTHPQRK